ncbi:MAG: DUF2294 domain-containing protein [Desulfomonilaceae bacterium]|nr:DUF2294 domain-containing protein [Desulfomonilaceae bacterium]
MLTTGQIEAQISEAIIKFEKEYMGRGPVETKTYIIEDLILVRLKGVITRAEHHLATSGDAGRGRDLIKQTRMELIEKARPLLESVIESIAGQSVVSLHTDISTRTGERVIIFTLKKEPALKDADKSIY